MTRWIEKDEKELGCRLQLRPDGTEGKRSPLGSLQIVNVKVDVHLFRYCPLGPRRRYVVFDAHGDEQQHAINVTTAWFSEVTVIFPPNNSAQKMLSGPGSSQSSDMAIRICGMRVLYVPMAFTTVGDTTDRSRGATSHRHDRSPSDPRSSGRRR